MQYLPACKITSPHGTRGEMKALPLCDGASFLAKLKHLYTTAEGGGETALLGVRDQGRMILVTLAGVDSMDAARAQTGKTFYFAKAEAKLPKGRYFIDDLLGCEVKDADSGKVYGKITAVDQPAAQDVYTVTDAAGAEHMIPVVPEFVTEINPDAGTVLVRPIPGMFGDAVNGDAD